MTAAQTERFASLNAEWHGVPCGTMLRIIRQMNPEGLYGPRAYEVERADGKLLPNVHVASKRTVVDGSFLEFA